MDINERFAANLVRCRKRAGLSQEELAIRASLHRTEISMLERAKRLPQIDTLVKLMGTLEASADDLLAGIAWLPGEVHPGRIDIRAAHPPHPENEYGHA
jgi:transcriptional regulator with XRE-family HTH domain